MPKLAKPSTGNEVADVLIAWAESFEEKPAR